MPPVIGMTRRVPPWKPPTVTGLPGATDSVQKCVSVGVGSISEVILQARVSKGRKTSQFDRRTPVAQTPVFMGFHISESSIIYIMRITDVEKECRGHMRQAGFAASGKLALWPPLAFSPGDSSCNPHATFSRLVEIMAALRNPDGGCPWDLEQDFATIKHYTIEEAYEVADNDRARRFRPPVRGTRRSAVAAGLSRPDGRRARHVRVR